MMYNVLCAWGAGGAGGRKDAAGFFTTTGTLPSAPRGSKPLGWPEWLASDCELTIIILKIIYIYIYENVCVCVYLCV